MRPVSWLAKASGDPIGCLVLWWKRRHTEEEAVGVGTGATTAAARTPGEDTTAPSHEQVSRTSRGGDVSVLCHSVGGLLFVCCPPKRRTHQPPLVTTLQKYWWHHYCAAHSLYRGKAVGGAL